MALKLVGTWQELSWSCTSVQCGCRVQYNNWDSVASPRDEHLLACIPYNLQSICTFLLVSLARLLWKENVFTSTWLLRKPLSKLCQHDQYSFFKITEYPSVLTLTLLWNFFWNPGAKSVDNCPTALQAAYRTRGWVSVRKGKTVLTMSGSNASICL